jgi:AhpD family alkylhydroperoxidase
MHPRFNFAKASPDSYKAVVALENFVQSSGLERRFIHLIKLRASQINGCAYCVDMHSKEARHDGLSEQWINLLCVWWESPVYDDRERALLRWVDSVTKIAQTGIPDADFEPLKQHFSQDHGGDRHDQHLEPPCRRLPFAASGGCGEQGCLRPFP